MSICLHSDSTDKDYEKTAITSLISELNQKCELFNEDDNFKSQVSDFQLKYMKEVIVLPSNVSYVTQSFPIPNYRHEDIPSLQVLCFIISQNIKL